MHLSAKADRGSVWAASEGRIDPDDEAVKTILEQLAESGDTDEDRLCTHCQTSPTPQERFAYFRENPNAWQSMARHMYGVSNHYA